MLSYRGVDIQIFLASLADMRKFLLNLHMSEKVDAALQEILGDERLATLKNAPNNLVLGRMIHALRIPELTGRLHDVLEFYAIMDQNNDSLELYRSLSRWGAFGRKFFVKKTQMDRDADAFFIRLCLQHHSSADFAQGTMVRQMFDQAVSDLTMDMPEQIGKHLAGTVLYLMLKKQNEGLDSAHSTALALSFSERHFVKSVLYRTMDLENKKRVLRSVSPFHRYTIVLADMPCSRDEAFKNLEPILSTLARVLTPYGESGDVLRSYIGTTGGPPRSCGFVIEALPVVAQAVAAALPDWPVFDEGGKRVPLAPPSGSAPPPALQP